MVTVFSTSTAAPVAAAAVSRPHAISFGLGSSLTLSRFSAYVAKRAGCHERRAAEDAAAVVPDLRSDSHHQEFSRLAGDNGPDPLVEYSMCIY
jgi:hypothetical protein